jgi:hypothetical protein
MFVRRIVIAVAAVVAAGWGIHHFTSSSSPDKSSLIASQTGASDCYSSGYQIISRLDRSKTDIYNCDIAGKWKCVTLENGLDHDVTVEVRLLWAGTLGGDKPDCILK